MGMNRYILLFISILSVYLVFSLTPISASEIGFFVNKKTVHLSGIGPVLNIINDIPPVSCTSRDYITLDMYVSSIPEFDIKDVSASIYDVYNDRTYDVSSSITCYPMNNLITDEMIKCRLKTPEILANMPKCPLDSIKNRLDIQMTLLTMNHEETVSASKDIIFYDPDTKPEMHIDFQATKPPYGIPEINCNTGSKITVPVVLTHTETLYGDFSWSYVINNTYYGENLINCEKVYSETGEDGIKDVYLCKLTISSSAFETCDYGMETTVGIYLETANAKLNDSFITTTINNDLNLGLHVKPLKTMECPIIDEDGLCVPKRPAQNLTVSLTGEVPEGIEIFQTRYKLGNENITDTICQKKTKTTYICPVFITYDNLPMPNKKGDYTQKSRELWVSFDVKFINYYTNISDTTTVTLNGTIISDILNTNNSIQKDKKFLEYVKNISSKISTAYSWVNAIRNCCFPSKESIKEALQDKTKFFKILMKFLLTYLWGPAKSNIDKVVNVIGMHGPAVVSCVAGETIKQIDKEVEKLKKFENNEIKEKLHVPSFDEAMLKYSATCFKKDFWQYVKSTWKRVLCIGLRFALQSFGFDICRLLDMPVIQKVLEFVDIALNVITSILGLMAFNKGIAEMAKVREIINVQQMSQKIMENYQNELSNTMETMITSMSADQLIDEMENPYNEMVELIYSTDRVGILKDGDEICSGDLFQIEYNFEKLTQDENFRSVITISGGPSIVLHELKGTYGPIGVDDILGIYDPANAQSKPYTFTLEYQNGKTISYTFNYINHPCK